MLLSHKNLTCLTYTHLYGIKSTQVYGQMTVLYYQAITKCCKHETRARIISVFVIFYKVLSTAKHSPISFINQSMNLLYSQFRITSKSYYQQIWSCSLAYYTMSTLYPCMWSHFYKMHLITTNFHQTFHYKNLNFHQTQLGRLVYC